ncbi:MAG: hypothetical protein QM790_03470 [Nibricoccus sp.]
MKKLFAIALLFVVYAMAVFAGKARSKGIAGDVIVEKFPTPVPNDISQANEIIWNFISKRPEQQWFIHYSTKDWRTNYDAFSVELVAKAKPSAMDYVRLATLLKKLPADPFIQQDRVSERACLPIGAYPLEIEGKKLWLIFCLWEYADDPSKTKYVDAPMVPGSATVKGPERKKVDWETVGHVLALVYYDDGEVFTFVTCD